MSSKQDLKSVLGVSKIVCKGTNGLQAIRSPLQLLNLAVVSSAKATLDNMETNLCICVPKNFIYKNKQQLDLANGL